MTEYVYVCPTSIATLTVSGDEIVGAGLTTTRTVGEEVVVAVGDAPAVVPVSVKIT
jgi:hypothetical protein